MQLGLKFYTLLALIALIGSALGQPVDGDQTAAQPILQKRFTAWNRQWGVSPYFNNNQWYIGNSRIWRYNNVVVARYNGNFYNIGQDLFSNNRYPNNIGLWNGH